MCETRARAVWAGKVRSMTERDADAVLRDAEATLETARLGLADLTGPDARRYMPGLRAVVTFGRAVTNVLQNLRTALEVRN